MEIIDLTDADKGKKKVVDRVEAKEQPEDNDDDEKLSENHNKMNKIVIKKEEVKKLVKQHNLLT